MEYNTARSKMLLPEYGRNVQNMITHAMQIEDREERNRATQAIIEVMGELNPHLRDVDDYRHKLWTHLFIMSDFKLDVDSPYEIPERESLEEKPAAMEYPKSKIRYGHFGQYTEKIKYFSRDNSRVGARLQFDFELQQGKWHHSGKSSKGKPIYEVWSKRADLGI